MSFSRRKVAVLRCFPAAERYLNHYAIYEGRNLVGTLPKTNKVPHFPDAADGAWREAYPPRFDETLNGYLVDDAPYHDLNFPDFPFLYVEIEARASGECHVRCLSDSPSITRDDIHGEALGQGQTYALGHRSILYFAHFKCEFTVIRAADDPPANDNEAASLTPTLILSRHDGSDDSDATQRPNGGIRPRTSSSQIEYNSATHALLQSQSQDRQSAVVISQGHINEEEEEGAASTRAMDQQSHSPSPSKQADASSVTSTVIIDRSDEELWIDEDISLPSQFASSQLTSLQHTQLHALSHMRLNSVQQQQQSSLLDTNRHIQADREEGGHLSGRSSKHGTAESPYPTISPFSESYDKLPAALHPAHYGQSPRRSQLHRIEDEIMLPSLQSQPRDGIDCGKIDAMLHAKKPVSKGESTLPDHRNVVGTSTSAGKSPLWPCLNPSPGEQRVWASEHAVKSWAKQVPTELAEMEHLDAAPPATEEEEEGERPSLSDSDGNEYYSGVRVMEGVRSTTRSSIGISAIQQLERRRIIRLNRYLRREAKKKRAEAEAAASHGSSSKQASTSSASASASASSKAATTEHVEEDGSISSSRKRGRSGRARRVYDPDVFRNLMSQASLKSSIAKATTFGPKSTHHHSPLMRKSNTSTRASGQSILRCVLL
ncbi:hypothetical protein SYNPS1DRAFT_30710 [Syncephalis pseudoplumigaleata]|uniref:Uncharacterized protein n=1 Tax=Syncephalis pseudoplumigaleata TaxID=1712513 RepID=A0A4P9YUB0_9FUNG|nr:hypothetical protein SYNPS1DRAFT_30710 [Syncephalis pseudoplumigaleata]|eukprot:RKP23537.1 hypothetical protein SYNPS1DRAFT_30710 [Syncephalis pseudoplumigaleata]